MLVMIITEFYIVKTRKYIRKNEKLGFGEKELAGGRERRGKPCTLGKKRIGEESSSRASIQGRGVSSFSLLLGMIGVMNT